MSVQRELRELKARSNIRPSIELSSRGRGGKLASDSRESRDQCHIWAIQRGKGGDGILAPRAPVQTRPFVLIASACAIQKVSNQSARSQRGPRVRVQIITVTIGWFK